VKTGPKSVRCAIYTRTSTDQGLEQDFNSLDAQYDASQAYIRSQTHAGWTLANLPTNQFLSSAPLERRFERLASVFFLRHRSIRDVFAEEVTDVLHVTPVFRIAVLQPEHAGCDVRRKASDVDDDNWLFAPGRQEDLALAERTLNA
jgi:hypothetical protein